MVERTDRQSEIVQSMIEQALISAQDFERECVNFAERQKFEEMANVIEELGEWIEEREIAWLERLEIEMFWETEGRLVFRSPASNAAFVIQPRSQQTFTAGRRIVQLDPDLPILDDDAYDEVLSCLLDWVGGEQNGSAERPD